MEPDHIRHHVSPAQPGGAGSELRQHQLRSFYHFGAARCQSAGLLQHRTQGCRSIPLIPASRSPGTSSGKAVGNSALQAASRLCLRGYGALQLFGHCHGVDYLFASRLRSSKRGLDSADSPVAGSPMPRSAGRPRASVGRPPCPSLCPGTGGLPIKAPALSMSARAATDLALRDSASSTPPATVHGQVKAYSSRGHWDFLRPGDANCLAPDRHRRYNRWCGACQIQAIGSSLDQQGVIIREHHQLHKIPVHPR